MGRRASSGASFRVRSIPSGPVVSTQGASAVTPYRLRPSGGLRRPPKFTHFSRGGLGSKYLLVQPPLPHELFDAKGCVTDAEPLRGAGLGPQRPPPGSRRIDRRGADPLGRRGSSVGIPLPPASGSSRNRCPPPRSARLEIPRRSSTRGHLSRGNRPIAARGVSRRGTPPTYPLRRPLYRWRAKCRH
jgi:hypothetical protein